MADLAGAEVSGYTVLRFCNSGEQMKTSVKKKVAERFTWADYQQWPDEQRCEIIDGQVYDMTPAPGTSHQELLMNLAARIYEYLKDKPCKIFVAPFDVRLSEKKENRNSCSNVVQPDISIICDQKKIDEKGCVGAPDMVVEILSASTASKDQVKKRRLYERHGVKEYWLIHPIERYAHIYALKGDNFEFIGVFDDTATLESQLFTGLAVKMAEILPVLKVAKEKAAPYKARK